MSELTPVKIIKKAEVCLDDARSSYLDSSLEACVNRAYYSIFHCIQALLLVSEIETKTHVGSHNKFRELFLKTGLWDREFNTILQRSFEKRQFSDYDYDEVLQEDAKESVEDAEHFFEATVFYLKQNNFLQ
jgi:uncharacterized protein (UPF0332 family)